MRKLFESNKISYYFDLIFISLIAFVYPSFSFRGGIYHILSLVFYGVFIIYACIRIFIRKKILFSLPSISLTLFLLSGIISTLINKNSNLTSSLLLCTIFTIIMSMYYSCENDSFSCFALGYALGTLAFTIYLFFISNFNVFDLNTNYFVNVNRICNSYTISSIFLVLYFFSCRKNFAITILLSILIVFFVVLLIILGSRGALTSFVIALFINLYMRFLPKHRKELIFGTIIVSILLIIVIIAIPTIGELFSRYFDFLSFMSGDANADYSTRERFNMQITSLYHFLESPLFGHGIDGYATIGPYHVYSHNNFTDILCNFGIIGFVLYQFPLIYSVYILIKFSKNHEKTTLLTLVSYLLFYQFIGVLYADKLNALIYGMLVGKAISIRLTSLQYKISPVEITQNSISRSKIN